MATRGPRHEDNTMAKWSRILILVASLALGLTYVLPLWSIRLEAPQYPEGLGMMIRINTVEGVKEHDLANINNLNHYIGMKRIVPETIPELKIMPMVVAVLIVSGLLVALLGRRRLLYAFTVGFVAVSLVGLADFWKWEYDYGHDLDEETAIIKIPGMSYQPPLIGSRDILNFTAHSWPASGGVVAILAVATAILVSVKEWRPGRDDASSLPHESGRDPGGTGDSGDGRPAPTSRPEDARKPATMATLLLAATALAACGEPAPRPLVAGVDGCADCLMVVDAGGHGAEIVARTGKIYTFDSAECMVNHLLHTMPDRDVHSTWVTDFADPGELVRAEKAHYLVSPMLDSPMGLGITAFARSEDRDGAVHVFGGRPASWEEVVELVAEAWPDGRPSMRHGGHSAALLPDRVTTPGS
ncbi:MAG: nitrous oxide reductase accessory protein NosL [Longimicrobiales bacterium]|nr:nitrous oxide reductase accessory protein NosL [Longimicrobiales bacterium]